MAAGPQRGTAGLEDAEKEGSLLAPTLGVAAAELLGDGLSALLRRLRPVPATPRVGKSPSLRVNWVVAGLAAGV